MNRLPLASRWAMPRTLVLTAAVAAACSSGTEPTPASSPTFPSSIAVGDSFAGELHAGDSIAVGIALHAGDAVVIHLRCTTGALGAYVSDDGLHSIASSTCSRDSSFNLAGTWRAGPAAHDGAYTLHVRSYGDKRATFSVAIPRVNSAPETAARTFTLHDTVSESLSNTDDADDFTFTAVGGSQLEIFLKGNHGSAGITADLLKDNQSGLTLLPQQLQIDAAQDTADLESAGSPRITVPATGTYHLWVRSSDARPEAGFAGPYQFMVYAVNPLPEHAPATLAPGDTVYESIDDVADIDDFRLTGTPGTAYLLGVQALGSAPHGVEVMSPSLNFMSVPAGSSASQILTIPDSGAVDITVTDLSSNGGMVRGPYRLSLVPASAPAPRAAVPRR